MSIKKPFVNSLAKFTPLCHRGARMEFPENTIPSFTRALEILPGAALELDVHETADARVVVWHDHILDLKTDGRGSIADTAFSELKKIDAGYNITFDRGRTYPFKGMGYRIPLLEEFLENFTSCPFSIDIKLDNTGLAERTVSIIKKHDALDRVVLGSFHDRIVKFIRNKYPEITSSSGKRDIICFLSLQKLGFARFAGECGDVFMVPEFWQSSYADDAGSQIRWMRIVSEGFIKKAQNSGIPVFVWTVNDEETMKKLIGWGVDGIVTDNPRLLKKVMIEHGLE